MLVIVPGSLIGHKGQPIYSVDISPDGKRFATGGGDQLVKVWSLPALIGTNDRISRSDEEQRQAEEKVLLCTMNSHTNAVNCVKFSSKGQLATASDDKTIMLWEHKPNAPVSNTFGLKTKNKEQWECVALLSGHHADVHDLAWSPDSKRLASCSIDNSIIIWDMQHKNIIRRLKGHDGWVQGVAWDPLNKYLATQGGDGTVIIYNIQDWSIVTTITDGFEAISLQKGSSSSTMYRQTSFCRLSWAPDGSHVCASRGTSRPKNSEGEQDRIVWVSPVYERGSWDCKIRFLGHKKTTTVTRFCQTLFRTPDSKIFTVCAVGSMDNSATLWTSLEKKPLMVLKYFVDQTYLDISWGPRGEDMIACAHDGKLLYLKFGEKDFPGKPLSKNEQASFLRPQRQLLTSLPESADALDEQPQEEDDVTMIDAQPNISAPMPRNTQEQRTSVENVLQVQRVIRQKDGRKRIIPVSLDDDEDIISTNNAFSQPIQQENERNNSPMKRVKMTRGYTNTGQQHIINTTGHTTERETVVISRHPELLLPIPATNNVISHTFTSTNISPLGVFLTDRTEAESVNDSKKHTKFLFSANVTINKASNKSGLSFFRNNHFSTKLEFFSSDEKIWFHTLQGKASHVSCNACYCVAVNRPCAPIKKATHEQPGLEHEEGSELYVYSTSGRQCLPRMVLDGLVHSLALSSNNYCLILLCNGQLNLYDLTKQEICLSINMKALLSSRPHGTQVSSVKLHIPTIYPDGKPQPLITLSTADVFVYSYDMQGWFLTNDTSSWASQFISRLDKKMLPGPSSEVKNNNEIGTLLAENVNLMDVQRVMNVTIGDVSSLGRDTEMEHTLSFLEQSICVSSLLKSNQEQKQWSQMYVKRLVSLVDTQSTLVWRLSDFFESLFRQMRVMIIAENLDEDKSKEMTNNLRHIEDLIRLLAVNKSSLLQRLRASLTETVKTLDEELEEIAAQL